MRNRHGLPFRAALVEHRERRLAVLIDRLRLGESQRAADVPLAQGTTSARREHEVIRLREPGRQLVTDKHQRELPRDRDRPRRSIRLRRTSLPVAVHLPREFDLGVIDVFQADVGPCEPRSSDTRAPVSAARVNSVRHGSSAAAIVCSSSAPSKMRRRLDCAGFGRSEDSIKDTGLLPDQPSRRAAYR